MLRITQTINNGSVVKLRLDGTITLESFAEIDRPALNTGQKLTLHWFWIWLA